MASASQAFDVPSSTPFTGRNGLVDKYFYFTMSLVVVGIVVWGFGHTVNSNLFHAAVARPRILWFHSAVFSGWALFFILQTGLVRTHNVRLHRTLGWFGLGLGMVMIPLGVTTAIMMGRFRVHTLHEAGAQFFEIVPIFDMLTFTTWLALGIYWRRKPELHRRFFYIATCGLLAAAFGRFPYISDHNLFYWCVDGVILLGVLRDLVVNRRVHMVYRVALPVLIVAQGFVVHVINSNPAWWVRIANAWMG